MLKSYFLETLKSVLGISISHYSTGVIDGPMNNRVKECLFPNTKKRVLINGQKGSNVYFYRFDFL